MKHLIAIALTIFNAWFFYDVGKHKGAAEALNWANTQVYPARHEALFVRPAYKIIDGKNVRQRYGKGDGSSYENAFSGINELECKTGDVARCWVIENIRVEEK